MMPCGNLLAWVKPWGSDAFVGAFIGEYALPDVQASAPLRRAPATQVCSSSDEAHQWVEDQAAALQLPVKWVRDLPR